MAEQLLEEMPGVKQEDNKLVSKLTGDPNPVHDEECMSHIEYDGKVYHKKPLIMGTIIETLAINCLARRFGENLHLHNLLTDFRGFLYPDEPVSAYLADTAPALPEEFEGDKIYTLSLRKNGAELAVVTLGFTGGRVEVSEEAAAKPARYAMLCAVEQPSGEKAAIKFDLPGFVLASRSRIVVSNIQNPEYSQLACLSNPDLFPVYKKHHAALSCYMQDLRMDSLIGFSLAAMQEGKPKRPDVYTTINAFLPSGRHLFKSQSQIATIPRAVALEKFIEDI